MHLASKLLENNFNYKQVGPKLLYESTTFTALIESTCTHLRGALGRISGRYKIYNPQLRRGCHGFVTNNKYFVTFIERITRKEIKMFLYPSHRGVHNCAHFGLPDGEPAASPLWKLVGLSLSGRFLKVGVLLYLPLSYISPTISLLLSFQVYEQFVRL